MKKRYFIAIAALLMAGCGRNFGGGAGPKGDPGEPGTPGNPGQDGKTPYENYVSEHPEYTGDEKQWYEDLANGVLGIEDETKIGSMLYGLVSGGGAIAISYLGMESVRFDMPDTFLAEPIKFIGENCFFRHSELETVTIGKYVESIGRYSFGGMSALSGVELPSSLKTIEQSAFYGSSSLGEIYIPSSVTTIGNTAFFGCSSLEEIYIPSSVTTIGNTAFCGLSPSATIYCEAPSKPDGWSDYWNGSPWAGYTNVVWGASRP